MSQSSTKQNSTSLRVFSLIWVFILLGVLGIQNSAVNSFINTYVAYPVDFILRHKLSQSPSLDRRLKILALDDQSVAYLNDKELPFEDLVLLLENIARQKPKVILLDRLLAKDPEGENVDLLLKRMAAIDVPIYTGAYSSGQKIKHRNEYPLKTVLHDYQSYSANKQLNLVDLGFAKRRGHVYAYGEKFQGAINSVGHMSIEQGLAFSPMYEYEGRYLLPYLGIYAADNYRIDQGGLRVNGHLVPMNDRGVSVLNYRPVIDYYRSSKSLRSMIARARKGVSERNIQEGDVVLIMFNFYTGGTSFTRSPLGNLPGGFVLATAVDSVLSGNWLEELGQEDFLIIVSALLGVFIGLRSGPILFWGISLLGATSYFVACIYLFAFHSVIVTWFLPIIAFLGSGLTFYVHKRLGSELLKVQIEKDYYSEKSLRLEEENKKIQLKERLNLGKAVQDILLPDEMVFEFNKYQIGMKYHSAQEMSGDWLYVWDVSPDEKRLILGDVVGKGPSAAVPVAVIIGIMGECEERGTSLEDALDRINRRLCILFKHEITSTCAAISLRNNGKVTLFNAGSPGWFFVKNTGTEYSPMRSSSLGLSEQLKIEVEDVSIEEELSLFSFTDGYMEGARAFKRLVRQLNKRENIDHDGIHESLDEAGEGFRLEDDRSLLAVKIKPK